MFCFFIHYKTASTLRGIFNFAHLAFVTFAPLMLSDWYGLLCFWVFFPFLSVHNLNIQIYLQLENTLVEKGYAEVIVGADEVAVAASPSGTAHALVNIDPLRSTFFMGCQDSSINYNDSTSDFNVWKDV